METKLLRFLMVDDDPLILEVTGKRFRKEGFEFCGLSNADGDFLTKVVKFAPDIISMDIDLKGYQRDGVTAAEVLQLDERTKNIPIVFVTNAEENALTEKARKLTSTIGFLVKAQFLPSELAVKIQELYNQSLKKNNA